MASSITTATRVTMLNGVVGLINQVQFLNGSTGVQTVSVNPSVFTVDSEGFIYSNTPILANNIPSGATLNVVKLLNSTQGELFSTTLQTEVTFPTAGTYTLTTSGIIITVSV